MNDPVDLGDLTWSGILGTLWGATGAFRCSSGIYEGERREGVGSSHRGMVTFSLGTVSEIGSHRGLVTVSGECWDTRPGRG